MTLRSRELQKLDESTSCEMEFSLISTKPFFGECADVDKKWAVEILREIYFLICEVDHAKRARFVKVKIVG